MEFVHLHIHTEYSLLESTARMDTLIEQASDAGMEALAITDKNGMHGVIPFYKKCEQAGIKPIIGIELWVEGLKRSGSFPVLLLAENNSGYRELMRLSTIKQTEQVITLDRTAAVLENAVVLFPYAESEPAALLRDGDPSGAEEVLEAWTGRVGALSMYMERQPVQDEDDMIQAWKELAAQQKLPLAAGFNVHMTSFDEREALLALKAVETGKPLSDVSLEHIKHQGWMKDEEGIRRLMENEPDVVREAGRIAQRCHVTIDFNQSLLPSFPLPEGHTAESFLRDQCFRGLKYRFGEPEQTVLERLEHELGIIHDMGFEDYFLLVADFVDFARRQGMLVGPGRGSAAGSLVSYVLEITDIDPVRHNLLFERFLNPERLNMPDIDIDFPDYRRDEVMEYAARTYGWEHVAQIVTFGTFGARAALRDAGRILEAPQALVDRLASFVPQGPGTSLRKTYKDNQVMRDLLEKESTAYAVFRLAVQLEGLPRHTSVHAAGVVMSGSRLFDHVPLMKKDGNILLTQYPMDDLEELGLLKMDFLGLKNLSLLERMTASIRYRENETIDLRRLPLDDESTYKMLSNGDTTGIFQLESAGMRRALKQIQPERFEDIAAVNALYRPGPMENIPVYAERKNNQTEPEYPHEDLRDILAPTYGVIVYQEQIMQIASTMAGYSFGQSDLLRRAVSKKDRRVLDQERTRFVTGAQKQGYDEQTASAVYDLIVKFADYGFNRSHAAAYSLIAYQLAYLKAHYPAHFYAALLTLHAGNPDKMGEYIREAAQKDIAILPPSVNESTAVFQAASRSIRFGLLPVKNVNAEMIRSLIEERRHVKYSGFIDFLMRLNPDVWRRRPLEMLIKAGAFDEFGTDRAVLLASLDRAVEYAAFQKDVGGLLPEGHMDFRFVDMPPFTELENYEAEKESAGFYLTGHPLHKYDRVLAPFEPVSFHEELPGNRNGVWAAGMVEEVKNVRTRQGQSMAFASLTDGTGSMEAVFFPNVYRTSHNLLQEQRPILIRGRADQKAEGNKLLVDEVLDLEELQRTVDDVLYLKLTSRQGDVQKAKKIKDIVKRYPGGTLVCLYYENEKTAVRLSDKYRVSEKDALLNDLKTVLPEEFVVLKKHRG
ncbi:DNA polymerase III subunit alpha [Salibacterium halotolerans]|uniref:DNA polymerase III subunit alpha n=1 Tax=Salibacterium halotolerans TaxID=1884432 RepID=A0A1I5VH17_9BACI|nr:DNA polymerase III subunit alpha [Salibacterium halotolerans]SFQ06753.1 DNA polymerase-3 subunit alpha [Salibacterium halotolerans]